MIISWLKNVAFIRLLNTSIVVIKKQVICINQEQSTASSRVTKFIAMADSRPNHGSLCSNPGSGVILCESKH